MDKRSGDTMQTAIDRRYQGKEEELHISNFDECSSRKGFFCPECGESVFPAIGKKNSFRHHKKGVIDCDLRVDGSSNQNFYQRVGLPIYLKRQRNQFYLCIGFYAVGENSISCAEKNGLKVYISNREKSCEYLVDFSFDYEMITLKILDFVPRDLENYSLAFSSTQGIQILEKRWGDFADGFGHDGGIFTFSETGGKKIRKNDTMTTNTPYYLLSRSGTFREKHGLSAEYLGYLSLKTESFEIRKIEINVSEEDDFTQIEEFLWTGYKIRLLYLSPTLIPLWPPTILSNDIHFTLGQGKMIARVVSQQKEPNVYEYFGADVEKAKVNHDIVGTRNIVTTEFFVRDLTPITVDRRYLANSVIFSNGYPETNLEQEFFIVNQISQEKFRNDTFIPSALLKYESNFASTIIVRKSGKNKKIIDYTSGETTIFHKADDVVEMLVYKRYGLILTLTPEKYDETVVDDDLLRKKLHPYLSKKAITVPRKYHDIFLIKKSYPLTFRLLKPNLLTGRIQPEILKILEKEGVI